MDKNYHCKQCQTQGQALENTQEQVIAESSKNTEKNLYEPQWSDMTKSEEEMVRSWDEVMNLDKITIDTWEQEIIETKPKETENLDEELKDKCLCTWRHTAGMSGKGGRSSGRREVPHPFIEGKKRNIKGNYVTWLELKNNPHTSTGPRTENANYPYHNRE